MKMRPPAMPNIPDIQAVMRAAATMRMSTLKDIVSHNPLQMGWKGLRNPMVAKHKFWRVLTRIHKWTALVIGTQIILWFASGFFMSFFNIDQVHGDHMAAGRTWQIRQEQIAPFEQAYKLYVESEREKHCTPQKKTAVS